MSDLTPDDFDRHLQSHSRRMEELNQKVQTAISCGNSSQIASIIAKYHTTLKIQERLNKLSNRLSDAATDVTELASSASTPGLNTSRPSFRDYLSPRHHEEPSISQTLTSSNPAIADVGFVGRGVRTQDSRISRTDNKGLYLETPDYIAPIWSAISRMNRPFRLSELRQVVSAELALRPRDLEIVRHNSVKSRRNGKPRWQHIFRSAFFHCVATNRRDCNAGRAAKLVRYIEAIEKEGRESVYMLTDAGIAEMRRRLPSQDTASPSTEVRVPGA